MSENHTHTYLPLTLWSMHISIYWSKVNIKCFKHEWSNNSMHTSKRIASKYQRRKRKLLFISRWINMDVKENFDGIISSVWKWLNHHNYCGSESLLCDMMQTSTTETKIKPRWYWSLIDWNESKWIESKKKRKYEQSINICLYIVE